MRKTFFVFLISVISAQVSFHGSVETRLGESKNGFYYNETSLNTHLYYGGFVNWFQFEFSDPPELGRRMNGIRKLRFEYQNGPLEVKLGDLYEIWGRGLILNSVDDQTIDRDSGVRGIGVQYKSDEYKIHFLTGRSELSSSTIYAPGYDSRTPNYTTNHNIYGINSEWDFNNHIIGMTFLQSKELHPVNTYPPDTLDLKIRYMSANYIYNNSLMDFYVEYVKNRSTMFTEEKDAYKDHLDGRGFYGNMNIYFSLFSINLEYINYRFGTLNPSNRWNNVDNYGMIQDYQNPPIANMFHETTLLNRTSHQTDFNNEVGYKLELFGSLTDRYEFLVNMSRSSRSHSWFMNNDFVWEKEGEPAILPLTDPAATPFKAFYGEMIGYFFDYAVNVKLGYSQSEDMIDLTYDSRTDTSRRTYYTYQFAKTIPLQFGFTFSNGWSIDAKIEMQNLKKGIWHTEKNNGEVIADSLISEFFDDDGKPVKSQQNTFMSISVGKTPKWTVAFTLDNTSIGELSFGMDEDNSSNSLEKILGLDKNKNWANIELVYNMTPSFRLSLMAGSLKGGLLCANGVCRIIEPFSNGVKLGIITTF